MAIVGGGSAGLAALKQLSDLGKQAVLLEAGPQIGSKNISGGLLYSKRSKNKRIYNVKISMALTLKVRLHWNDVSQNMYYMPLLEVGFLVLILQIYMSTIQISRILY